jgi:hypothetical protein
VRIKSNGDFSKISEPEEFQRQICIIMQDIVSALNGNIEFDLNMRSETLQIVFTAANVEMAINHNMARVPTGYIVAGANTATAIYNLADPDQNYIYLYSSAIANVQVIVF